MSVVYGNTPSPFYYYLSNLKWHGTGMVRFIFFLRKIGNMEINQNRERLLAADYYTTIYIVIIIVVLYYMVYIIKYPTPSNDWRAVQASATIAPMVVGFSFHSFASSYPCAV